MQTLAKKNNKNHFEHTDVITIIGHSHKSFDDAVKTALEQLACPTAGHNHHPHLEFVSFNVVDMGGVLHHDHDKEECSVVHYSVRLDVEGKHTHGHGHEH